MLERLLARVAIPLQRSCFARPRPSVPRAGFLELVTRYLQFRE